MAKNNEFLNEVINLKVDPNELALCKSEIFSSFEENVQDEIKLACMRDAALTLLLDRSILLVSAIVSAAKLFESEKTFSDALDSMNETNTTGVDFQNGYVSLVCKKMVQLDLDDIDNGDPEFAIQSNLDIHIIKTRIQMILSHMN